MEKTTTYKAKGLCFGTLWGGDGNASYPARKFTAKSKEELDEQINKAVKEGSIDSGMGFQKMLGALMEVETITVVEIDGKDFSNSEYETEFYGELTDKQKDFLEERWFES